VIIAGGSRNPAVVTAGLNKMLAALNEGVDTWG